MYPVTKSIFCRQNWVFPFVLPLETFQIEIRHQSKNSNPDHLQLLKVRIRIRLQVIQDVLRLLKILFCHQYMNSKYNLMIRVTHGVQFLVRKSVGKNSVSRVRFASWMNFGPDSYFESGPKVRTVWKWIKTDIWIDHVSNSSFGQLSNCSNAHFWSRFEVRFWSPG